MKQEQNIEDRMIYIAYAEDHLTVRETIVDYLENPGGISVVIKAAHGEELIAQLEQAAVMPGVCLMDIMMPKMNGFETIAVIRQRWPELKVLVLTGYLRDEYIIKMILAGACGYLSKSCHPKEIRKAIADVMDHGVYITEMFTPRLIASVRDRRLEVPHLTEKELQLLRLSISDMTYHEIAMIMHTTGKSVEGYRNKLFQKLGVRTKVGLAMYAVRYGYVSIDPGISAI